MITTILFDFDDTLGNREIYAYENYKRLVLPYVNTDDPFEKEAIIQDCMLYEQRGNTKKEYVRARVESQYGFKLPYEDFDRMWEENLWRSAVLFDDVEETIVYLQEKYKLGILTNGDSYGQRKKIEQSGLSRWFDEHNVIISGDCAYRKPDPEIFWMMAEKMHAKAEECVFVGDTFGTDIIGAIRAGMIPVWIKHQHRRPNESAVREIAKISDLKKWY
jgi:putative hydrolase of the HAD superfamily